MNDAADYNKIILLIIMEPKAIGEAPKETKQELQEGTPFEVLKTQVYPVINDIILKVTQIRLSSSITSSNPKK
jgi:hypothetical protein